jgi:flagellar hook-length control protein FliK
VASADEAVTTPLGTAIQATETRPAEATATPALSTLSQATIETTARIAAQIVRKLEGRSTRFEMSLTPDGLGQVDVSLDIDADGKLIALMAFDNPLAATELRGRVDELRRQLQEAGFTVADDALSFAERDASAGQQGSAFDRRPDPRNARAFGAASRLEADADRLLTPSRWIPLTLTPDRVDMKV